MKRTSLLLRSGLLQAALLIGLCLSQGLAATATFTNTPTAVSNTYAGPITLQIGGLTNGETVVVQEFLDVNTNGVIDAGDWLVQQFQLTDGKASVIGGIVNSNVPGDTTPTNSAITAQVSFNSGNKVQGFAGNYLLKLSSPGGHFTPVTNSFAVTNLPYAQGFTGYVVCSGTNVPNAAVLLFNGPVFDSGFQAAVVADNSGAYTLKAPPGTYGLGAIKSGYVVNALTAPMVTLGSSTISTNVSMVPTTSSLAGSVVDAANPSRGVAGVMVTAKSDSGLMAISSTDTNGIFNFGVASGQWYLGADDGALVSHGYVGLQDRTNVAAGTSGITLAVPKANALFYGTVRDGLGSPLAGIDVYAYDNDNQYATDGYTDVNGNYCVAALGGLGADLWHLELTTDTNPTNYVYLQAPFEENGGTNLLPGLAVRQDFGALLATNWISGYLKDGNNNPIGGVWIWVQATINSGSYRAGSATDPTGHYAINVCNGSWTVGVQCGGGGQSLGNQYLCPNSQTITIANNNSNNVNFAALLPTSQIKGYVRDNSSVPIANVQVYAYLPAGGGPGPGATTDSSGYYSFFVPNGTWNVGLNCCGNNALSPLGYLCVGEQSTNVFNSTNTVNFSVPHASYQITGHLRDASNNPIPNAGIFADSSSYHACATTDATGAYTLYVNSSDWYVTVSVGPPYLCCPNGRSVTISNANVVLDFSAVLAPYTISGWVRNASSQPFTNLHVQVSANIGADDYMLDAYTGSDGSYSFTVGDGLWWLGIDCSGLPGGYLCPDEAGINIAGASVVTNFTIQSCGALQILTTSPLPDGQVGAGYDQYLQASSCYPNFYWIVSGNFLPPGLQLDTSGELHGTPTTNGTWNFTVQVTDGNDHATTRSLSLTINPMPPDVVSYYVMKMEVFRQIDAANLVPDTSHGPFAAKAAIVQPSLNSVWIARMDLPAGGYVGFPSGASDIELVAREYYTDQASFDADYPSGDYTFAMFTVHNGYQAPVLTAPVAVYPSAQRLSNFAAAQAINPANAFTLQWTNPSDATTNDTIWVWITDTSGNMVFDTPYPPTNHSTCLKGTATSAMVPANTFQLGGAYIGCIGFFRTNSINTTALPGAVGLTLVGVVTAFPMVAPSASSPVLSQPTRLSDTQFGFLLSGTSGQNYTVLVSTNVARPLSSWSTVLTTNLSGSSAFIQDNQATNQQRFYRVRTGL